ncbi:LppU/SCO3897 family protein [Actinomadura rugatobispora]|uniref:Uncharacterized protein n=1 Tax=Actinomadura rugatobispora TaxID=1994 RepID=A0ABW1AEU3_9ACTN|nr:hypothetical protein GCM10010200_054240 [Actinomadura rugatobispora]
MVRVRARLGAIVVVVLAGATGCVLDEDHPRNASPGECLEVKGRGGTTKDPGDFRIVSCAAPNAAHHDLGPGDIGCPDRTPGESQESPYGEIVHNSTSPSGSDWALCLTLNAKTGDCFYQQVGFPDGRVTKVACGPSATYRVVNVLPGRADMNACGQVAVFPERGDLARPRAFVYPRPPLTICTDRA